MHGKLVTGKRITLSSLQVSHQKVDEGDRHEEKKLEVGRRHQRSLTLETRFTPRVKTRREETNDCRREEACSTERKQKGDLERERLHMRSLRSKMLLPYRPSQS